MSKNQALKELKDSYEEQSQIYSGTINSLSNELVAFREESMKETEEGELPGHYYQAFQTVAD